MDNVNKPRHYTSTSIECIEVTSKLPFTHGNAVKYVWRHKQKNGREDLLKAKWYLDHLVKNSYPLSSTISTRQKTDLQHAVINVDGLDDEQKEFVCRIFDALFGVEVQNKLYKLIDKMLSIYDN